MSPRSIAQRFHAASETDLDDNASTDVETVVDGLVTRVQDVMSPVAG